MLEDKLTSDYKQAMRDKDGVKSSTISFLRSQLKYVMIEKKLDKLPDDDVIAVIKKQVKQRLDSIDQYGKGGRQDLVDKEKAELVILKSYLPEEMSAHELKGVVDAAIKEAQAVSIKDMGKVMKVLMTKTGGRVDNKLMSETVKERLSQL